jgi:hypothetical protein
LLSFHWVQRVIMKAVAMVQHPRLASWEGCAFRRVRNLRKTNKELHCVGSNSEGKFATTTIYPLHFHQRVDHLWALRQKHRRSAPVLAPIDRRSDGRCECGRRATAPSMSIHVRLGLVEHHWTCSGCGRQWSTSTVVPVGSVAFDLAE